MPPPGWAPNAYFQLSFTQLHVPHGMVLATRVPRFRVPPPGGPGEGAVDLTADNRALLAPGNEQFMKDTLVRWRKGRCGPSVWDITRAALLEWAGGQAVNGGCMGHRTARHGTARHLGGC